MSEQKFEPYQPVMVRGTRGIWFGTFFSHYETASGEVHYATTSGSSFDTENILPFNDETKHLLGNAGEPTPKWTPEAYELVAVRDNEEESWKARMFMRMNDGFFMCRRERGLELESFRYCKPARKVFNIPEA